MTALSMHQNYQ